MKNGGKRLSGFVENHRDRFALKHNNAFATAVGQCLRYYEFMEVLIERYSEASRLYVLASERLIETAPSQTGEMTLELAGNLESLSNATKILHLEIESFYQFAKIYLDKVAHFIQLYFGNARGASLAGHRKLVKNLDAYVQVQQLTLPNGMHELASELKEKISEFRDKQIVHEWSPRTVRGTICKITGPPEVRMSLNKIYPRPDEDPQKNSIELTSLFKELDRYVGLVVDFVELNQARTVLVLAGNEDTTA